MCTKFTALEVGSGDAFLLEESESNWKCLYDAGGSKSTIVSLMKKKKITKINLAICSHNDIDHANGFIGLLQSNIIIDEIWLPGTWASVLKYVRDKRVGREEAYFLDRVEYEYNIKTIDDSIFRINEDGPFAENNNEITFLLDPESEETIEDFDDSLSCYSELIELNEVIKELFPLPYLYFLLHHRKQGIEAKYISLVLAIDNIIKIAGLAYQKGCKIRWFNPVDYCTLDSVNYGFVALNSHELFSVQKPRNAHCFALLCLLTVVNKYSLVFDCWKDDIPIIRFSADSDCTYKSASYNEKIIVTAPHHGSDDNRKVYNAINNNNVIWVRSDGKSRKRPCSDFKNLKNKYCLACYTHGFRKEIIFEYDKGSKQWNCISGYSCKC